MKTRTSLRIIAAMLALAAQATFASSCAKEDTADNGERDEKITQNADNDDKDGDGYESTVLNIDWSFENGVLTVGGGYIMEDLYDEDNDEFLTAPWDEHKNDIRKVVIEEGCEYLGDASFASYTSLADVVLPSSLKEIGAAAFFGCTSLKEIALPEGLNVICRYAFANCSNLKAPTLPETLKLIEDHGFYKCNAFTSVNIPASVERIGDYAFAYIDAMTAVTVASSEDAISLGNGVFPDTATVTYSN